MTTNRRTIAKAAPQGLPVPNPARPRPGRAWAGAGVLALACLLVAPSRPSPLGLGEVRTWMYQFQNMEAKASVDRLAKSTYDLLVVEPVGTYRNARPADMKEMLTRLRELRPGRLVLAYFDLAEADSHRAYWDSGWKAPSRGQKGVPDFLVGPDPDGWKDTYLVAYWDPRWQKLLRADVQAVVSSGFDGLCLDWAGAYRDPGVASLAKSSQVNAAQAMVDLVSRVRQDAQALNPKTLLLLQNESGL
ncbi:MAG TPA: endo alpha-1,4 polygalactosaminidase, partial [Planctomycetota bacterium]|nr:endo alpha-1,4 polygalactosaminidase [Planctomycetota bacterium]